MEKRIVVSDDLVSLFLSLSLKEGYYTFYYQNADLSTTQSAHIINILREEGKSIPDMFSMLSHLLLLYEGIDIPISNNQIYPVHLCGSITSAARIISGKPSWHHGAYPLPLKEDVFNNKLAIAFKPLVINYCMNTASLPYLTDLAVKTTGSVEGLYSYVYDWFYNNNALKRNDYLDYLLDIIPTIAYKTTQNETNDHHKIFKVYSDIHNSLLELLLLHQIAQEGPYDFYTPAFSNFYTTPNADDAYCILKTQISMIMEEQPAFESLTDILRFREKKSTDIKLLRDEVSALESLLVQGEREQAIQKAINDVRSANQSLIKNTVAKRTARIATYLSVPISVLEYFTFGTPYSILIGVVGTTAQWIQDQSDSKSNWLFVAR